MITFNPNGGDLGRANIKHTHPLEFHVALPHIADILEQLHNSQISDMPFKYAFEFSSVYKDMVQIEMMTAKLPPHVAFYECDGRKLYEMRGASGGIVSGLVCYLVTYDGKTRHNGSYTQ